MRFSSDPEALVRLQRWLVADHGFEPRSADEPGRLERIVDGEWLVGVEIDGRVFADPSFDPKGSVPMFYLTRIDVERVLAEVQGRQWVPGGGRPRSFSSFELRKIVASKRVRWWSGTVASPVLEKVDFATMQAETLEAVAFVEAICDLETWLVDYVHDDYGWKWFSPPGWGWARLVQHAMAAESDYAKDFYGWVSRPDPEAWEGLQAWMAANPDGVELHASTNRRLREQGRLLAPGELDLERCRTIDLVGRLEASEEFGEVLAVNAEINVILQEAVELPGGGEMVAGTQLPTRVTALTGAVGAEKYPVPLSTRNDQVPHWDEVCVHIVPGLIRNRAEREEADHDYVYEDTQKLLGYAATQGLVFPYVRLNSGETVDGESVPTTYPITVTRVQIWEIGR